MNCEQIQSYVDVSWREEEMQTLDMLGNHGFKRIDNIELIKKSLNAITIIYRKLKKKNMEFLLT